MKIDSIYKKCIKPSSATPHHLQYFKLSDYHQRFPDHHSNLTFFYPAESIITDHASNFALKSNLLQQSLSQTLTLYYPFAGRFQNEDIIICNDDGILFIEARTDTPLSDFLNQPDPNLMCNIHKHLVPTHADAKAEADAGKTVEISISNGSMILLKFILFGCGGTAISVSITHKIIDLVSIVTFFRSWSSSCFHVRASHNTNVLSTDVKIVEPDLNFIGQTITAGPDTTSSAKPVLSYALSGTKSMAKRLFFSPSKIEQLKTKIISAIEKSEQDHQHDYRLSRVDVVVALIWKCALAAASTSKKDGHHNQTFRPSVMIFAVNIRPRIIPPLPETCIGCLACQFYMMVEKESDLELHELANKLVATKAHAKEVGEKFQGDHDQQVGFEAIMKYFEEERIEFMKNLWKKDVLFYICSSFCRSSLLETDFRMGETIVGNKFK
ncbi:vinorine synthase-like [Quillaja saponaria]|uniref:Vinorine synthase-like n=1 Tax=Quillaja saponaria TaxID=32244 RepID=A0AAD7PY35_QUISA|nr:vinorine synthase-like [Quillaja saponaria]